MSTYYDRCLDVERRGAEIVSAYVQHLTGIPPMPITDKYLQLTIGDFVCQFAKLGATSLELKTEQKYTGNLFVETWQNREWGTPGWLHTSQAKLLWTYYVDADKLVSVSTPALKHWLLNKANPAIDRFREVRVKQAQRNDTVGVLVPLHILREARLENWYEAQPRKIIEASNA